MLTYADRLAAMRRTKLEHTQQKLQQNGCADMDDFGTVPLPPDYHVEPWYNSRNGSFYGYDGMAENFCRVLAAHPPYVDPMEPCVGGGGICWSTIAEICIICRRGARSS